MSRISRASRFQEAQQALRLAKRKRLIREGPHIEKFSEKDNARQGFFEREECECIVGFLPDYLKDLTRFAYHTGWRKGEILTLEWRDIHGDVIRLRPEIAKNKDGRVIILLGELAGQSHQLCAKIFNR